MSYTPFLTSNQIFDRYQVDIPYKLVVNTGITIQEVKIYQIIMSVIEYQQIQEALFKADALFCHKFNIRPDQADEIMIQSPEYQNLESLQKASGRALQTIHSLRDQGYILE